MDIEDIQEDLLKYARDGRNDVEFRVAIAADQFGSFVRHITHDEKLNPGCRPHGTKESEVDAAGHLLVQMMTLVALRGINLEKAIGVALVNLQEKDFQKRNGTSIDKGTIAQEGTALGRAWIIPEGQKMSFPPDIDTKLYVLVASHPEPDAHLAKFAGIITDQGSLGCHAAIIAREHGIPCIVGTGCATLLIEDSKHVLIHATEKEYVIKFKGSEGFKPCTQQ